MPRMLLQRHQLLSKDNRTQRPQQPQRAKQLSWQRRLDVTQRELRTNTTMLRAWRQEPTCLPRQHFRPRHR